MSATVGDSIEIYWPLDKEYYGAKVTAFNPVAHLYTLNYFDGEVEDINLNKECWRLLEKKVSPKANHLPWMSDKPKKDAKKGRADNHGKNEPETVLTPPNVKNSVIQPAPVKQKKGSSEIKSTVPHVNVTTPIIAVELKESCSQFNRKAPAKPKKKRPSPTIIPGPAVKKTQRMFRQCSFSRKDIFQPVRPVRSRPLLLIANCVVSWSTLPPLKSRPHSFQVKQCIQYACNMLTTAATNPSYLKKLGQKKGLQPEFLFDHLQKRCQITTQPNQKRIVLEDVSKIFRISNDAADFKKGEVDIIKAIRVTLHALANFES